MNEPPFNEMMALELERFARKLREGSVHPVALEVERRPFGNELITVVMTVPAYVPPSLNCRCIPVPLTSQTFQWKIDNERSDEQIEGPQHHV